MADVWVIQGRSRPSLLLESTHAKRVAGDLLGQQLHGHAAPEGFVTRKPYLTHAAVA